MPYPIPTKEPLNTYYSMILFKVPLVIPTRTLGLAMLFLNAIFGVFVQVCNLVPAPSPCSSTHSQPTKIFLTMRLQRETAGRGAFAVYTSVHPLRSPFLRCFSCDLCDRLFRSGVQVYHFSYHTFSSLDHWNFDDRQLGHLYHCNLSSISAHLKPMFTSP